jgi:tetratricopeptide (TPR) repeat protein
MYRKAVSARPTDCSCEIQFFGHFLASVGRVEDAIEQFQRGHDMQPLGASANSSLAGALSAAGRDEEARPIIERTIELWPDRTTLRRIRLRMAFWNRRYDDGLRLIADPAADFTASERSAWTAAFEALQSGNAAQAKTAAAGIEQLTRGSGAFDPLAVAALGALGEDRAALAAAERLVERRGPLNLRVLFEPSMARARHHPAFAELVRRHGLFSYWRETGNGPDFCKEADAPSLCRALGPV